MSKRAYADILRDLAALEAEKRAHPEYATARRQALARQFPPDVADVILQHQFGKLGTLQDLVVSVDFRPQDEQHDVDCMWRLEASFERGKYTFWCDDAVDWPDELCHLDARFDMSALRLWHDALAADPDDCRALTTFYWACGNLADDTRATPAWAFERKARRLRDVARHKSKREVMW
jgi:hypothetical protein